VNEATIIHLGRQVLTIESKALLTSSSRLGEEFVRAVQIMHACKGRIVVTGMGKSGLIGGKIAATLASTGTPAFSLHPADAFHGDFGVVIRGDTILAISYSGETEEVCRLLPMIKRLGVPLISMTGNKQSTLAKNSDVVLDIHIQQEACTLGLAPTTSTTVSLALGDALAVVLLNKRGFNAEDFALLHPGGNLGKKLMKVKDLMHTGKELPAVTEETSLRETIYEISSKKFGVTSVIDQAEKVTGIITDGDLRRALEKGGDILDKPSKLFMTRNPKTIESDAIVAIALQRMERYAITSLLVLNDSGELEGLIHLHDLLKAGIV
jgi:arabinose-5-phosphate isomerase